MSRPRAPSREPARPWPPLRGRRGARWLLPWLLAAGATAQTTAPAVGDAGPASATAAPRDDKLQPWLRDRLAAAPPTALLPVYCVIAERIDPQLWYPRVLELDLGARRRLVVGELRTWAKRTQAPLLQLLQRAVAAGTAAAPTANWLGNFVQFRGDAATIRAAAALPSVALVCADEAPPLAAVADGNLRTAVAATAVAATAAAPPLTPGDGPLATGAAVAWLLGFRGQGVLIANLDGGLAAHQDLDQRRWTNPGEIPGNGIDDDQNGFVDDVNGWAFDRGSALIDDGGGHGTMTAGLLCGDGSCSGIAYGQAPAAQLMTCRILSETSQWNAVQYALAMGADIATSSFSYKANFVPPPNYRLHRDVAAASLAAGLIRCNSAGNDGLFAADPTSPMRVPLNVSAPACVPSPFGDPNDAAGGLSGVLGVGAFDFVQGVLAASSPQGPFAWSLADVLVNLPGYPAAQWDSLHHDDYPWNLGSSPGLLKPDLLGPANSTTTTAGPCGAALFAGTSNAAPCVAGAIALWKSANPSLTPEDAAMIALRTATPRGPLPGKQNGYGAGTIDALRGLAMAASLLRLDHRSQWHVDHSLQTSTVHVAVDGLPNSLAAVFVGYQRAPGTLGPVQLDLGSPIDLLFYGLTDAQGDLAQAVSVATAPLGTEFFAQAVLWDQTVTQQFVAGNAIGITFTP